MNWLHSAVVIFHLLIAASIVALVLLQRGKGADAGAGFGAGASGTVFGARGSASFLSRTTATLAALFICTSLTLAYLGGRNTEAPKSVIDRVGVPQDSAPALPESVPPAPTAPATTTPAPTTNDTNPTTTNSQPVETPSAPPANETAPPAEQPKPQ
jgi:preprotein translocase subunit SecG